jgi:hypothetical protein
MPEEQDVQQTGLPSTYSWLAFRLHKSRQALRHYTAVYMYSDTIRYADQVIIAKVSDKQDCTFTLPLSSSLQFSFTAISLAPYNIFIAKAQENIIFSSKLITEIRN